MIPRSTSLGSWTKGVRPTRALAMEAIRYGVGVWLTLTLVFLVVQVWPGSPTAGLAPNNPQYAGYVQQNEATFALDQPVWTRYGVWLADVFTGSLGISYYWKTPVLDMVARLVAPTLELGAIMALWAVLLGAVLGWAAASRRFRILAAASRGVGLVVYALPLFWALIVALVGAYQAWGVSLGATFPPPPPYPQDRGPTGFPILDAILSGNLGLAWLAVWTTFLLALPGGAALSLPILVRAKGAFERAREAPAFWAPGGRFVRPPILGHMVAGVAGGVAAVLPLLVSAVVVTEWLAGRRGLGWLLIQSLDHLDMPMFQGALTVLVLVTIAAAFPFALVGAGLVRQAASPSFPPRRSIESGEVERWLRGVARRIRSTGAYRFWVGLVLAAIPLVLAAAAPALTPYGPLQRVTDSSCSATSPPMFQLQPPCPAHPLGTDYFGFDILSQVLNGGAFLVMASLVALCMAAGIALALALLCGVFGRAVSVPSRVALGAVATIPCLVLLFLISLSGPFGVAGTEAALVVVFVPVLFRDASTLVSRLEPRVGLAHAGVARGPELADRLSASVAAILPGFVAKMPRRLAEIGLLFETFSFLGFVFPTQADWAFITWEAVEVQAYLIGNWPWLLVPGVVLFLYMAGLMILSDGLGFVLTSERPKPAPAAVILEPVPTPPLPPAANP